MAHRFRERLSAGERLVGTMVTLGAPEVTEILATTGFDWLFVDAEHSPMTATDIRGLLRAAGETPCLVRIAVANEVAVKKALDVGAAGIIAPQVNSAGLAEKVVRWSKYAPQGSRGVGIGRAHGYGLKFGEYMASANETVTVVVQAEHIEAVENIEAIVQVPGLDGVLIGPYDLSASLGLTGQVDHPQVVAAIEQVTATCQSAGLPLGIFGLTAEAIQPYIEQGYTLIIAGVDTVMLGGAAGAMLSNLNAL